MRLLVHLQLSLFRSKRRIQFLCGNCNVTYYGKTIRHLKVRASEHMDLSALTGKVCKFATKYCCPRSFTFLFPSSCIDDFSILTTARNKFELELPSLNKTTTSAPLYLFDKVYLPREFMTLLHECW